jgi:hypothetical protein
MGQGGVQMYGLSGQFSVLCATCACVCAHPLQPVWAKTLHITVRHACCLLCGPASIKLGNRGAVFAVGPAITTLSSKVASSWVSMGGTRVETPHCCPCMQAVCKPSWKRRSAGASSCAGACARIHNACSMLWWSHTAANSHHARAMTMRCWCLVALRALCTVPAGCALLMHSRPA